MWPAVVMDESNVGARGVLKLARVDQSVLVQFFGTHDFARFSTFIRDLVGLTLKVTFSLCSCFLNDLIRLYTRMNFER